MTGAAGSHRWLLWSGEGEEEGKQEKDEDPGSNARAICPVEGLDSLVSTLKSASVPLRAFGLKFVVEDEESGSVEINEESMEVMETVLDLLEDDEDVVDVFHNAR